MDAFERQERRKYEVAKRLRAQLARKEESCAKEVKTWFYKEVTRKLVGGVRKETPRFYGGMFGRALSLRETASSL